MRTTLPSPRGIWLVRHGHLGRTCGRARSPTPQGSGLDPMTRYTERAVIIESAQTPALAHRHNMVGLEGRVGQRDRMTARVTANPTHAVGPEAPLGPPIQMHQPALQQNSLLAAPGAGSVVSTQQRVAHVLGRTSQQSLVNAFLATPGAPVLRHLPPTPGALAFPTPQLSA